MSCPSLDGDSNAEVLTKAWDIKQDGITNLALSVPFQDDGGSDSGAASILFVKSLAYIAVFIIFNFLLRTGICVRRHPEQ
jgi:hypothetical protein